MALSGNSNDWSGVYALVEILHTGSLIPGAPNLSAQDTEMPVSRVYREDVQGIVTYRIQPEKITVKCGDAETEISREELEQAANVLFSYIRKGLPEENEIPEAEDLLEKLRFSEFQSVSEDRSDFTVFYFNTGTGCEQSSPVTVKSLPAGVFLLPAHRAANLKYDILQVKFSNPESNRINRIDGPQEVRMRLIEIMRLGAKLKYTAPESKIFQDNLSLVDLHFPKLLAEITRLFFTTELTTVETIVEEIKVTNPYKIREELIIKNGFYEYKVKQFLHALTAGMKPAKIYRGYGRPLSHLLVTRKGGLRFYSADDPEPFDNYLFRNARLQVADCEKHKFGFIEKENGQWLIKLNTTISL